MAQPAVKKKAPAKKPAATKKPAAPRGPAAVSPQVVRTEEELLRQRQIFGIVVIALALLLLVNLLLAPAAASAEDSGLGVVSLYLNRLLRFFAGSGAIVLPLFLLGYGVLFCLSRSALGQRPRGTGLLLIFVSFLGFLQLSQPLGAASMKEYLAQAVQGQGGGLLGGIIDFCLLKTVGKPGAVIIFVTLILIGLLLFLQTSLTAIGRLVRQGGSKARQALRPPEPLDMDMDENPLASKRPAPLVEPEQMMIADLPAPVRRGAEPAPTEAIIDLPWTQPAPQPALAPAAPPPAPAPQRPTEPAFVRQFMPTISDAPGSPIESFFPPELPCLSEKSAPPPPVPAPEPERQPVSFFPPLLADDEESAAPPAPPLAVSQPEPAAEPEDESQPPAAPQPPPRQPRRVTAERAPAPAAAAPAPVPGVYQLPTSDLVEMGVRVKNPRLNKAITDGVGILESTLDSFGVKATVTQVVAGPAVTRYELQPAPGVKVSRITSLSDDIALSLAAQSVRIEAPIPGKSAIGIEVSRKEVDVVYFREMIDSDAFRNSQAKLSFVLGKNIGGENMVGNLAKMPHLLIAGATGSGKSICINNIICSLLYKATPDEVKIMLIDPKKVEMMQYAHLPHLIAPVVNDSKKAANALKWVVNEMEARYDLFVAASVKDFDGYNQSHRDNPLPHVVVIIDELADLMMVARHDVEDSICRLAQMARAAGIHLVVATQRPSVDVITGLIKANIPSRIAFAVSSYTDSRTILDMGGAEKLLGRGDMLYSPVGIGKPMRIQGSYIDPADVNRLVEYCSAQAKPSFSQAAVAAANNEEIAAPAAKDEDEGDDLFYDAGSLIITSGQASTSYLQRRLAIGNPRAARIMDLLEVKGVVGGPNGSKPREIIMSLPEFEEKYGCH